MELQTITFFLFYCSNGFTLWIFHYSTSMQYKTGKGNDTKNRSVSTTYHIIYICHDPPVAILSLNPNWFTINPHDFPAMKENLMHIRWQLLISAEVTYILCRNIVEFCLQFMMNATFKTLLFVPFLLDFHPFL